MMFRARYAICLVALIWQTTAADACPLVRTVDKANAIHKALGKLLDHAPVKCQQTFQFSACSKSRLDSGEQSSLVTHFHNGSLFFQLHWYQAVDLHTFWQRTWKATPDHIVDRITDLTKLPSGYAKRMHDHVRASTTTWQLYAVTCSAFGISSDHHVEIGFYIGSEPFVRR